MYYSLTGDAPWQFTPDINLGDTPKLNSLVQLQSQIRSPVTLGQKLPGSIIASENKEYKIQAGTWGGYNQTCSGLPCL